MLQHSAELSQAGNLVPQWRKVVGTMPGACSSTEEQEWVYMNWTPVHWEHHFMHMYNGFKTNGVWGLNPI